MSPLSSLMEEVLPERTGEMGGGIVHGQPLSQHRFGAWEESAHQSHADFGSSNVAASIDWMIYSELFAQLY